MKDKTEAQERKAPQSKARPYHPPRVVVYGAVREITSSGTGSKTENNKGNGQPMRRP